MTTTPIRQPAYDEPELFALLPAELQAQFSHLAPFLGAEQRAADAKEEQAKRIAAQEQWAYEQEEGRRRARMRREQEQLDGTLPPDAEMFRDLRLKPRITEAHDFQSIVRTPVVQGLFFRNSLTWIAGPSGTFKSFVTADLAFRHGQEGMDYHGKRMTSGRSLIVVAEGAAGYADRKTAWEKEHGREVKNVSIYPAPLQLADTLKEIPALLSYLREEDDAGRPFTLIIFDTQAMCTVGVDENSSEMNLVINVLHQVREVSGACVMTVHHFGKNKSAGMRGSSMIYAAADTVCVLKRKEDALDVSLSTAQADEGKQKDAIAEADLLTLDMKAHPVGVDYFGDPVYSLVPVLDESGSHDTHDAPPETPTALPDVTEQQLEHLKLIAFYENRGATPADMMARWLETHEAVPNLRQNIRNRMIELAKTTPPLTEQYVAKGPWFITPAGVAVLARQAALGARWVERAGRRRAPRGVEIEGQEQVSQQVSGGSAKPAAETCET